MKLLKKILNTIGMDKLQKKQATQKSYIRSSKDYWEQRYKSDKTSGAGSYGRLALFKADILNQFVKDYKINDVLELGCGDGHQLTLAEYPNYIGFDVSDKAILLCQSLFKMDSTKQFYSMFDETHKNLKADLTLSLDVIYHLVEDNVFEDYMERLFESSNHYVIIYSSNYDGYLAKHVRCRKFTNWITKHKKEQWQLERYIKNKYPFDVSNPENTSMADFYIYKKVL